MRDSCVIALAGNPNVGKSTVFNALTGLRQHTGNWPGKTVASAQGVCRWKGKEISLVDVPGAYSLWAQSAEEEVASEVLCFGGADAVIAVCDATCLERNLNLIFQILEITPRVVVCVNLMDEAQKKGIAVDLPALARQLGVPVIGACAREKKGVRDLLAAAGDVMARCPAPNRVRYDPAVEAAAASLGAVLEKKLGGILDPRFSALRLLEGDPCFHGELARRVPLDQETEDAVLRAREALGMTAEEVSAHVVARIFAAAEEACALAVRPAGQEERQWKIDRLLTGKYSGPPVMLLLLALIFFLTLKGANWPSAWLAEGFAQLGKILDQGLSRLPLSPFLKALILEGLYGTLSQVVAVMLPPMAIFFPLFTLLEDLGYLPRVAFVLDGCFEKCRACGKQALTMCMGFGCNAAGVMGCRIIDSPRERLIATLTNSLMPCNGRFPTLIAMLTLFFAGSGAGGTLLSVGMLTGLVMLAVGVTLLLSFLLSLTVLRGVPSSYTLELPPYRMPQIGRVLVRSVLDRTLFVLGRAVAVAAPAGVIIFLLSHIQAGNGTLLFHISRFLDAPGRLLGLDGAILCAFLLGWPANEIVLPILLMAYTAGERLLSVSDIAALGTVLRQHGWTALTALNLMLFSLFHFPCSTTLITIFQETRSKKWTLLAFVLPTLVGAALCMLTTAFSKIL